MTKPEATKAARILLKRMKTKGWKLHVWENCGWHYGIHVNNGAMSLTESGKRTRCLIANPGGRFSGSYDWHSEKWFSDPNRSVAHALRLASEYSHRVAIHITDIERILAGNERIKNE